MEREQQVLNFIELFFKRDGKVSPARQIAADFWFCSSRVAQNYIVLLQAKGCLLR